ncbi:COBW domain-containing protein [Capsaspora owczarzaki ATCC 30864]|uniref:COBW domain-containing protein n=1 Tax=Capsaspora owczarzaki (strain ATCC 30864) TaxID=595528 RepID=A0A0D2X516_CAPO3|nr:COBW domain-containing protein [Capsaspora owczarzaki ATCC 30864]KJE97024.1 COBW domain-containing protein [Capsaspora owczarzaki ATCC 30864]|eukprot:XP_004343384.1 COBW domain-containing protein [Capsaspora owczarzaki ATCC 30864]
MLIVLTDAHKEHLSFLTTVDASVVAEFANLAVEFVRVGINPKLYNAAAQKLGIAPDAIRNAVEGLMYLLVESAKLMTTEIDFHDSILTLGFSEELRQQLLQLYLDNRKEIRLILSEMTINVPSYHNLEWRLDVQLASRSLRRQTDPIVLLKLETRTQEVQQQFLQTDPAGLVHLTSVLDAALSELKSAHTRRILRNIK